MLSLEDAINLFEVTPVYQFSIRTFTCTELGKVLLFLGICAIPKKINVLSVNDIYVQPVNLVDTEVAMSAIAEGDSSTGPADLLHGNDVVQVAHP